jgi:hypothetical protein
MATIDDGKRADRFAALPRARLSRFTLSFALPALAVAVLALIAWASLTFGIPVFMFTRDMAVMANFHPFVAIASSLGAFMMCAAAACCLFATSAARATGQAMPWHVTAAGLFSLYLMVDDFYELHDRMLPGYFGIPQPLIYVFIAGAAVAITWRWWRQYFAYRPWLLAAALGFLGFSMGFDVVEGVFGRVFGVWQFFWEDGAKLVGISLWATYFIGLAQRTLSSPAQGTAQ